MIPEIWASTIADYLEQRGVVGVLQPDDGSGSNDRFVPRRVRVSYHWQGGTPARTEVRFKIAAPTDRQFVNLETEHYSVISTESASWGSEWEDVLITIPPTSSLNVEIREVSRFRIRIQLDDQRLDDGSYIRELSVENLNQRGTINAIRILETNLPDLLRIRNSGVEEDSFYRASGLIGFLNDERTRLEFSPFAIIPERSRRPVAGPALHDAVTSGILSERTARLFETKGYGNLFEFQADSIAKIGEWLDDGPQSSAILLTVGTAAGKTEAFGMPLLDRYSEDRPYLGTQGLFVYPTKALQADQARRFFEYLAVFNEDREHPISIGLLNGDIPGRIEDVSRLEKRGEFRSPFAKCPAANCAGTIRFTVDDNGDDLRTDPYCPECRRTYPWVRFYRGQIESASSSKPPNILLIIPDLLNRLISNSMAWSSQTLFGRPVHVCAGCGGYRPSSTRTLRGGESCKACGVQLSEPISVAPALVVFDEAHMLKGIFGSNVALMIARIRKIAAHYGHNPVFVGSSATIANPDEFGLQLFGGNVDVVVGREEQSDQEPTRYHLFFMPVKVSVLNAVGHTLTGCFVSDANNNEINRILLFSDSKRTVYQLEMSLPAFYATEAGMFVEGLFSSTASHTGDLSFDERQRIELGFDRGDYRVLLATQTLEVGVDFNNLQLEIQTGATYSYNDYIQRVGRAGRRGVPALVICILRPQVPLDYYYYEHCKELTQFTEATLDDVPMRSDNFFLIEQQVPAAIQDFLISREDGARLMWFFREATRVLSTQTDALDQYLYDVFLSDHALEPDLIRSAIQRGVNRVIAALREMDSGFTSDALSPLIRLAIRNTDVQIPVDSEDFEQHWGISLARELDEENVGPDDEDVPVDAGGSD
jgi:hypothetical protein